MRAIVICMRRVRFFFIIIFVVFLSGCMGVKIPFLSGDDAGRVQKNYDISGMSEDKESLAYLRLIMKDRLSQIEKNIDKNSNDKDENEDKGENENNRLREQAYQAAYIERTLKGELLKALHSRGYYDAQIFFEKADLQGEGSSDGFDGRYNIKAGFRYKVAKISVEPSSYRDYLKNITLKSGDNLDSKAVLKAQAELKNMVAGKGCYFSLQVKNKVILDRKSHNADVEFIVNAGKEGVFGSVIFKGQKTVKEEYLKKLIPWKSGDCFSRKKIDMLRQSLLSSGLFSYAKVILPKEVPDDGAIEVRVDLKERAHRSVKIGATYYTDDGVGVVLGWEHRNFLGGAEKFNADLGFSMLRQSLDVSMSKPFFLRKGQNLDLSGFIERQDTDAFEELGLGGGFRINRKLGRYLTASLGSDLKITNIKKKNDDKKDTFGLISGASSLVYDSRDDPLDPHKGWQVNAEFEPFIDLLANSDPFAKLQLLVSHYIKFADNLVWANRFKVGSVAGAKDIPSTERFFAGGGGSVRGFVYQGVGPRENNDPVGGRSLVEMSTEFRYKFTDTMGGVAFIDAGQVSENISPAIGDLSVGAGLGFRYYTDFGPLRFDVATPLTDRGAADSSVQIYISIGQAF